MPSWRELTTLKLFKHVFRRTLPNMNNDQIIELFERLCNVADPVFGFIHEQRNAWFDDLRLKVFHLDPKYQGSPWQTATFRETAYGLSSKFITNLQSSKEANLPAYYTNNDKFKNFQYAEIGNFFKGKSQERTEKLRSAVLQNQ